MDNATATPTRVDEAETLLRQAARKLEPLRDYHDDPASPHTVPAPTFAFELAMIAANALAASREVGA